MPDRVVVFGATSLVGRHVLAQLHEADVIAVSRGAVESRDAGQGVRWIRVPGAVPAAHGVISLAPIWATASCLSSMDGLPGRVVALSSTSVLTKRTSRDDADQALARRLADGEAEVTRWCGTRGVPLVLLRPTMIYGDGRDGNVSAIARVIARFGVVPVVGGGRGLRQPVHAEDVAQACVAALRGGPASGGTYVLSGGEQVPYREMVARTASAIGRRVRVVSVPAPVARGLVRVARLLPRYRVYSVGLIDRMIEDLVFDHHAAAADLGFRPRGFSPTAADVMPAAHDASPSSA